MEHPETGQLWKDANDEPWRILDVEHPYLTIERQRDNKIIKVRIESIEAMPRQTMPPAPVYSGDFCRNCGSADVRRTGTCLFCHSCFESSEGCS